MKTRAIPYEGPRRDCSGCSADAVATLDKKPYCLSCLDIAEGAPAYRRAKAPAPVRIDAPRAAAHEAIPHGPRETTPATAICGGCGKDRPVNRFLGRDTSGPCQYCNASKAKGSGPGKALDKPPAATAPPVPAASAPKKPKIYGKPILAPFVPLANLTAADAPAPAPPTSCDPPVPPSMAAVLLAPLAANLGAFLEARGVYDLMLEYFGKRISLEKLITALEALKS